MLFLHKKQMVHVGRQRTAQTHGPAEKLFATSIWVTAWVCSLIVRQSNVYYISSHGDVLRSHVKYQTSDCKDLVVQQCPGMLQHLSWLKQEGILFIQPKQAICCSSLRLNQWSKMLSVNWLKWSLSLRSNVISILVICVSLPEFALGLISLAPYVTVWRQVNATVSWGEKTLFCLRTLTESTWQKYWKVPPFMHFLIFQYKRLIWLRRQARRWRLSSGVNVYWSRKTWACKFWFVCACCLQGGCRAESITIGMWTWLLERLWKSHRPMIKNSVRASLQPHHSECLHKGTVHSKKIKK